MSSDDEDDYDSTVMEPLASESEEDDFYSSYMDSLPSSPESEWDDSGRETESSTSPEIRKRILYEERARQTTKLAKKLYPFYKVHDRFNSHIFFNVMAYAIVSVTVKSKKYFLRSLPCFLNTSWSWFLTDGFVRDLYFTIQKGDVDQNFSLTGLLEPVPQVDEMEDVKLEETFLEGLEKTGESVNITLLVR